MLISQSHHTTLIQLGNIMVLMSEKEVNVHLKICWDGRSHAKCFYHRNRQKDENKIKILKGCS